MLQGSGARKAWASSHSSYEALYDELRKTDVLAVDGSGHVVFTQDHVFSSPSAAAAVISGRPTNGRTAWREKNTGMTYGEWQSAAIEQDGAAANWFSDPF